MLTSKWAYILVLRPIYFATVIKINIINNIYDAEAQTLLYMSLIKLELGISVLIISRKRG